MDGRHKIGKGTNLSLMGERRVLEDDYVEKTDVTREKEKNTCGLGRNAIYDYNNGDSIDIGDIYIYI